MEHLLHSSILALLLYGLYRIALKNTTGFQMHRAYLLLIPIVSAMVPFMVIPINIGFASNKAITTLSQSSTINSEIDGLNTIVVQSTQESLVNWSWILMAVYGLGVMIAGVFLVIKFARLWQWKKHGNLIDHDGIQVIKVQGLEAAFSFLNYVFISDDLNDQEYEHILTHELTHIKQRHSWDLLFYEFMRVMFWFHPVAYLAQRDLKVVHEYIADERTINIHGKRAYYENLLKQVMHCPDYSFTNSFYKLNSIKNRLQMIHNTQQSRFPYRKLIWMLPILLASLFYTACTTEPEVEDADLDPKMTAFQESGEFKDLTNVEYDLLKKIVNREFVPGNDLQPDEDYYTLLERARLNYNNAATKAIKSVNVTKDEETNENSVDIVYDNEKLYRMMVNTRFMTDLDNDQLQEYAKSSLTENDVEVIEVVEIEEVPVNELNDVHVLNVDTDVPFAVIEEVPTYPGCTGTNQERKECLQENIAKLVNKNFNTGLANELGLVGKQRILVQFKIDKNGNVANIVSRAEATELQIEAARVINQLPQMKPGIQRGQTVNVLYSLPIIFEVIK